MSNPSSASAVSGFTFKSIGKPPSLLSRIRDADSTLVSYPPTETSPSPPPESAAPASPVVSQPAGKRSLLGRLEGVPSAAPTTPARPDIVANRTNSAAVVQDIFNIPLITPTSNLPPNPTQTSNPVMSSFCLTIPPEPTAPSTFTSPVSTSAILDASNPTASRPSSTSIPPVDLHALASTATTADLYRRISELSTERMELNEASLARQRVLDAQREYLRRHEETRSAAAREKEQMDKLVDAVLDALQKTEKARERQEKRWAEDNLQLEKLLKAKAQDEEEEKRRKDEEARIQAQQEADAAAARKTQEELAERAARARKEAEEAKAREKAAAEKAARERREAEEAKAREKAAADKAAADKAAAEKAAAEKAAAEKSAAEKAAAEKAARERREVEEAKAREKEAAERATRARQEAEAAKARENEAAAARAKAAEEEAKAKEREKLEKIRQEREEKERLERLEAEARAKAEEVARARAEKLESDRMRAGLVAKTQAATAERVKKQAEERAKLPVAGASLDAAKSSNTAAPIKVEKEQAIARPPSAASTTSQRAPQPVITTTKAAAPPRLDVPLPSPAPTPALSRGSQHPLAAPGLVPHVSRPPTPAQQRTLANTSNGPQQSLPPTQPPTHIPALFQHPEDTVDVKPSLDVLQYPTPSASLPPTQTMDNIKTSPSMSSRKIQRSLWPPVSTPPTSSVSSQPTSSGPAHQPQIATPGIARVQSRDSSSQSGTARAAKPADSAPAYGVKPEPVEVPLPPQGTHKQTPHRVQQQTSSATTKATPPVASAVPPKHVPPIPRNSAVAQAPLAPVASLPAPVSLPPKPPLPPPPVTTRPQSTAAPVKAPIPATQNFNARNGDRSGRPPAPAGTNSTRNTIATRLDPVPPPNNSSARAAPSNQPHVAPPPWQEHDDDPWITDPRGRDEMDYHRERYPSPDRRADHWSPIRDHPPARQPFPVHSSHYQPLSPPRKRLHDSYPDDAPYKRPRFHERSRSPPPRRAFNGPDRAYTPPSPRYRSPRRTPSPSRYTPEPPVSPYASSVGSRRSYDWGPGPSAPHDRSYSPQQPRSRQLPARPPPTLPPVDRSMPDYNQQRPSSSGTQTVASTSQPQAESASVWRRAVPMPIQVPVRDVHPDLLSRIDHGEGSTNRGRRGRGNGRGRGRGGANAARGGRGGSSRPLADRFQDGHRDLQSRITG